MSEGATRCSCACIVVMCMHRAHCAHVVIDLSKSACVKLAYACDLRRVTVSVRVCDKPSLLLHACQCMTLMAECGF
jgi:hypothetical protein